MVPSHREELTRILAKLVKKTIRLNENSNPVILDGNLILYNLELTIFGAIRMLDLNLNRLRWESTIRRGLNDRKISKLTILRCSDSIISLKITFTWIGFNLYCFSLHWQWIRVLSPHSLESTILLSICSRTNQFIGGLLSTEDGRPVLQD